MIAALLLALQATPAAAADTAAPAPVAVSTASPAQRTAAEELVRVARIDETMRATVDRQLAQVRSGAQLSAQLDSNPAIRAVRARNPQAWDQAIARVAAKQADALAGEMTEMMPQARAHAVQAYADNFTAAQLKELIAFYRSPIGQLLVAKTPAVSEQTTAWLQQELPRRLGPILAAMAPEMQREFGPLLPKPPAPSALPR